MFKNTLLKIQIAISWLSTKFSTHGCFVRVGSHVTFYFFFSLVSYTRRKRKKNVIWMAPTLDSRVSADFSLFVYSIDNFNEK